MSTSRNTVNQLPPMLANPLSAWWSGFDYVFGYQLKMFREFWGMADKEA